MNNPLRTLSESVLERQHDVGSSKKDKNLNNYTSDTNFVDTRNNNFKLISIHF